MFNTPILFILFDRLDTAQKVFDKIKEQKPKYLYLAADWARKNKEWESERCEKVKEEIMKQIDWECKVKTRFLKKNLWPKDAVSSSITRFFENEEQWIIFEHDCLPDTSFFWFCETLLEKYKDDERVMHISWSCPFPEKFYKKDTYIFTPYEHIWWWATWRRAWKYYDVEMKSLNNFILNNQINHISNDFFTRKVNAHHFKEVYDWKLNTWDYQRRYTIWSNHWLSIQPLTNLISNIWFWENALNTKNDLWQANKKLYKIDYQNLFHPRDFVLNDKYLKLDEKYSQFSFMQYVAIYLKKMWLYKIVAKLLGFKV